jgi:hypothetical protein
MDTRINFGSNVFVNEADRHERRHVSPFNLDNTRNETQANPFETSGNLEADTKSEIYQENA